MIVADVNLVAYLLISGEHTEEALTVLRQDAAWAFPYLWRSEFRNILAMHIQHRSMARSAALLLWENAAALAREREYAVDPAAVIDLVVRLPLTAYDAEYVALARHLGIFLVTFDQKLRQAAPKVALSAEEFLRRK